MMPDDALKKLENASEWVEFESQETLAQAVGILLGCHRHSFAVLPNGRWSMVISNMAFQCLKDRLPNYTEVLDLHES